MPITFTFDVEQATANSNDRARVVACFKRLGWEHIGGSAWRYPALGTENVSEDWFNQVVPALMYFRSMACHADWNVSRFTLDAHSEAGYRAAEGLGAKIEDGEGIKMYETDAAVLSEARLRQFISDATDSLE